MSDQTTLPVAPADLPAVLRARAEDAGKFSRAAQNAFLEAAETVEASIRAWQQEALTLEEAARESGYSADYLGEMVREGRIANAGRKNAPRIRRADLPKKPPRARGRPPLKVASGGTRSSSFEQIAREATRSKLRR